MEKESEELIALARAEVTGPELEIVEAVIRAPEPTGLVAEVLEETPVEPEKVEARQVDMRSRIQAMSMAEKIKTAILGNALARRLLILDPSRLIQECVLNNPKLTMSEVEDFARNPNVDKQVLRGISGRTTWMRVYKVKVNLVTNPKCPADLSLRWLRFLHDNEVKQIARSRNVPQVLQLAARKKLEDGE